MGITQDEITAFLDEAGIPLTTSETYGKWERGRNFPTVNTVLVLADLLQVDTDYLLGRQEAHIKELADRTGLSQEAVQKLYYPNFRSPLTHQKVTGIEKAAGVTAEDPYGKEKDLLSRLIMNNRFWELLEAVSNLERMVHDNHSQLAGLSAGPEDPISLLVALGNDKRVEELELPARRYLIGIMFANLLEELLTAPEPFPETEWEDCPEE